MSDFCQNPTKNNLVQKIMNEDENRRRNKRGKKERERERKKIDGKR